VSKTDAVKLGASLIGLVVKLVQLVLSGEPLDVVRKRVMTQVEADARDHTDKTDDLSAEIDKALKE